MLGSKYLGEAGKNPKALDPAAQAKRNRTAIIGALGVVAIIGIGLTIELHSFVTLIRSLIWIAPIAFFTMFFLEKGWEPAERRKIAVVAILFLFTSIFWAAFEQAGSTLNLFADRFTDCTLFGFSFPSSWFQSVNSIFLIAFAPVFAWLWVKLGKREPSSPAKFSMGLTFVGLGYLLLVPAAMIVASTGGKVGPNWLIGVYFLHTFGELSLSPVGLSMVTKLAPQRIVGQMMGIWFMTISLGNSIGGQVAGLFESYPLPTLFGTVFGTTIAAAIILALLVKPIKKLMGGVN